VFHDIFALFHGVSVTMQSRRNHSVIDRTPRPTLQEVRIYFWHALHHYMERRYIQNLDVFLSLCEDYVIKTSYGDRLKIVEKVFNMFLDSQSPDYVHMDPNTIRTCQKRLEAGRESGQLPTDLLEQMENFVKEKFQVVLRAFFESKEYYFACRKPNGLLWRVTRVSRLSYSTCSLLLDKVMGSLLELADSGDLTCVPHLSSQNRERFRAMAHNLNRHLLQLRSNIHVVAYLTKEACMRETMRESHAASHAIGDPGISQLEGNAWKNY